MCFDKTGTLTKGELTITDFHFPDKSSIAKTFALQVARDLEVPSHHPLGKSSEIVCDIVRWKIIDCK